MKSPKWSVEEHHRYSHSICFEDVSKDWSGKILLRSDVHHDNSHCDWDMEKKHLEMAKEADAPIVDGGDLFCAMQGKWDKRADTSACRPEHKEGNYLDALVSTASDFYEEYADQFALISPGNHETSIIKRHETCLTTRLCERIRAHSQHCRLRAGAYSGYIRIKARRKGSNSNYSLVIARHHGYGGGGPVTRGVIQTNRQSVYQPDADIVWSGHTHDSWQVPISRARLRPNGDVYIDRQVHVKTAGYKDEYLPHSGWHIERGGPPKPKGAAWLHFWIDRPSEKMHYEIREAL